MTNYRRYKLEGGVYFFTVNIAERRKTLLTDRIQVLREAFRQVKEDHPFTMDAVVVLPDHLHAIWTLPEGDDNFSLRWRQIKSAFSRALEKGEPLSKSRVMGNEEYGSGVFGSTPFVMKRTMPCMLTISITTPSSMAM